MMNSCTDAFSGNDYARGWNQHFGKSNEREYISEAVNIRDYTEAVKWMIILMAAVQDVNQATVSRCL